MAHHQNEGLRTDSTTDEYVRPGGGTTGAGYAGLGQQGGQHVTTGTGGGYGTGGLGTEQHGQEGHLRRTGSGSSSSSEDDGEGGRRRKKKGLTEKIKEKLPGGGGRGEKTEGGHPAQQMYPSTTTAPGGESKGIMEKIKDKLPGGHHP